MLESMLALGLERGLVRLMDEADFHVKWEGQAHPPVNETTDYVAMSPDGKYVANVNSDREPYTLWDVATGALHRRGKGGVRAVAFSPCGQRIATGNKDSVAVLWDTETGETQQRMRPCSSACSFKAACSLSFSADGARLASAVNYGSTCVWDAATGAILQTINCTQTSTVHFSPTESRTLGCALNGQATLWDINSGKVIRSFEGTVFAVFSPDGQTIATCGNSHRDVQLVSPET